MGCSPFSNSRDAVSCRRSCQRRVLTSKSSALAFLSVRFQMQITALTLAPNTGPVGFSGVTSAGPNRERPTRASALSATAARWRNTATARRDSGRTAGTPLFSAPRAPGGKRRRRFPRSSHSQRTLNSAPCRRLVSIASSKASAAHGLPLAERSACGFSNSPVHRRRSLASLPDGLQMFFKGFASASVPHSLRAISKRWLMTWSSSRMAFSARPAARRSSRYFAKSAPRRFASVRCDRRLSIQRWIRRFS